MQARYYDPLIGRFYSTDPIGYQDQLNLYAYVANDPVNLTDPTGMGSENKIEANTCSRLGGGSCAGSYSGSITMPGSNTTKSTFQITPSGKTYTVNHTAQGQGESAATEDPSGFKDAIDTYANVVTLPIGGLELGVAKGTTTAVTEGMTLFRVFGGEARGLGQSFTTVNPGAVANFREAAGLFSGNTGRFVLEGRLTSTEGVLFREALPGPGGVGGGLPEVVVPNAANQICVLCVSGVNPPF